jgi:hypothetical protein
MRPWNALATGPLGSVPNAERKSTSSDFRRCRLQPTAANARKIWNDRALVTVNGRKFNQKCQKYDSSESAQHQIILGISGFDIFAIFPLRNFLASSYAHGSVHRRLVDALVIRKLLSESQPAPNRADVPRYADAGSSKHIVVHIFITK